MTQRGPEKPDILYVITKSYWGGAQRYVFELARAMNTSTKVAVACGGNGMLIKKLHEAQIPVFPIGAFERDIKIFKDVSALWELFVLFRTLRPRVVHLNSPKAGGLGAIAARLAGVPKIIFTCHGLPFEEDRSWWQRVLIRIFTWFTLLFCDTVIAITEANLEALRAFPLTGRERITLVPLGVGNFDMLPRETARAELHVQPPQNGSTATIIGTIAELHPNKGLKYLIRAMAVLHKKSIPAQCVIIGGGELERELREEIEESGLSHHVILCGFLDDARRYLSAFDIFAFPSIKEGLPYAALEAGRAGLPLVGSDIPGICTALGGEENGILVGPKNTAALADALTKLVNDPNLRNQYGERFRTHVVSAFSAERMIQETAVLYR